MFGGAGRDQGGPQDVAACCLMFPQHHSCLVWHRGYQPQLGLMPLWKPRFPDGKRAKVPGLPGMARVL